jgi:hypothetical protein
MLLDDLFETASLPLIPKQLPRVRGSYGAFIITMDPKDFLALTTTDEEELKSIQNPRRPFPHDREHFAKDRYDGDKDFGRYDIPFLKVRFPSGQIFGHEGRHRSNMVMQAGGKRAPVVIYPYEESEYEGRIEYFSNDDEDSDERKVKRLGPFHSYDEARAAAKAERHSMVMDDIYVIRDTVESLRGGQLKGAPERSEGWDKAAWRVEDFPKQLLGQYNETVVVRDYRVGLVKGYRHHTR